MTNNIKNLEQLDGRCRKVKVHLREFIGALRDRDIGDEVAPAYPEQSALPSHVEDLQFPPVLLE